MRVTYIYTMLFLLSSCLSCASFGPLHKAALNGDAGTMSMLIANGLDPNERDQYGATPLFYASTVAATELLLQSGASVNEKDNEGRTPIFFARSRQIAGALINAGADITTSSMKFGTPLIFHVMNDDPEIVETLLRMGANPNEGNYTPLHLAAQRGYIKVAQVLIQYGANVNATTSGADSQSVLDQAKLWQHKDMIKLLKEHGAKD